MVRYLLIVARTEPDLWRYLKHNFAGDDKVEVVLDRRRGERRQRTQPHEPERRRGERRRQPGTEKELQYRSLVIIRLESSAFSRRSPVWGETA